MIALYLTSMRKILIYPIKAILLAIFISFSSYGAYADDLDLLLKQLEIFLMISDFWKLKHQSFSPYMVEQMPVLLLHITILLTKNFISELRMNYI